MDTVRAPDQDLQSYILVFVGLVASLLALLVIALYVGGTQWMAPRTSESSMALMPPPGTRAAPRVPTRHSERLRALQTATTAATPF